MKINSDIRITVTMSITEARVITEALYKAYEWDSDKPLDLIRHGLHKQFIDATEGVE